tara:strand:- start:488 stop:814 length:327 start_codon:yes stop_codon:yes gene_type:complete
LIKRLLIFFILFTSDSALASSALHASHISNIIVQEQSIVLHGDGYLYFDGFKGPGSIEIYSIIGNQIAVFSIQELFQFKLTSPLESGNMYIIRVNSNGETKTFKIVAS